MPEENEEAEAESELLLIGTVTVGVFMDEGGKRIYSMDIEGLSTDDAIVAIERAKFNELVGEVFGDDEE